MVSNAYLVLSYLIGPVKVGLNFSFCKIEFCQTEYCVFLVAHSDEKLLDTVYAIILKKLHADNSEERAAALKLIHNLPPLCR